MPIAMGSDGVHHFCFQRDTRRELHTLTLHSSKTRASQWDVFRSRPKAIKYSCYSAPELVQVNRAIDGTFVARMVFKLSSGGEL